MTVVVITASLDRTWITPLAAMQTRGIACVVVSLDVPAFERREAEDAARDAGTPIEEPDPEPTVSTQAWRALRHSLAEFDIPVYRVGPTTPLAQALAS